MTSYLTYLECSNCANSYPADQEQHLCTACGGILLARYDLSGIRAEVPRQAIESRSWGEGLWRYAELLPVSSREARVTLGEGATPLLALEGLSEELDVEL
jgi:threonine synthase